MRGFLALLVLIPACADPLVCGDGTEEVDAVCTAPTPEEPLPPRMADLLEALPACVPSEGPVTLDLVAGCADGACVGMSVDEVDAALGTSGTCEPYSFDPTTIGCDWPNGISISFDDLDEDGSVDPGSRADALSLRPPFSGATEDGLGLGASMRCFLDHLGAPESVTWDREGSEYLVSRLDFFDEGVFVTDDGFSDLSFRPDGRVDSLYLFGAPGL